MGSDADGASSSSKVYSLRGKKLGEDRYEALKLTSEEDIQPYVDEIAKVQGLEEIHLGGNTLGIGACKALGSALETQKNLKVADFADIFTGRLISEIPDALRALCDSLVGHTSLVELNLSDNAFGGRSAEPMVNFLKHNHHFSVLKLNNNGLGVTGGEIVANALVEAAEELNQQGKPSQLRTVICGRNRLEDGSAPVWAKAYAAHKNLEEVRMFQNGIRMDGIIAIAQGLASCPNLKVLDLQDNTATVRGSRGIAASLPRWPHLEILNLSDCLLKPKGGYLVIDALHKGDNKKLRTLQLQYCDLDRKALARIGSAIDSGALQNVEKLEINGNWADEEDECIEKIKSALEKHGHEDALDELDEMDPEGEDEDEDAEEGEDEAEAEAKGKEEEASKPEDGAKAADETSKPERDDATPVAPAAAGAAAGVGAVTAGIAAASLGGQIAKADAIPKEATEEEAKAADTAAQVAESAQEAPEESQAADTAAEVAESAQEAPEEKRPDVTSEVPEKTQETEEEKSAIAPSSEDIPKGPQEMAGDEQVAAPAAQVEESAITPGGEDTAQSPQEVADDKEAAITAAQVADSAQEVPEEKVAAENAADVAESVEDVPEEKQTETQSQSATTPVAQEPASSDVQDHKREATAAAGTAAAAGAAAGGAALAKTTSAEPNTGRGATSVQPSTAEAPVIPVPAAVRDPKHKGSGSVDLSGELYGNEGAARAPTASTSQQQQDSLASAPETSASGTGAASATQSGHEAPAKKKKGFRAALGAVRELLR